MTDPYLVTLTVDSRLAYAFRALEVLAAFLPGIVAWQTDRDAACKTAPPMLHDLRGAGMLATSSVLLISAACFSIESMMAAIVFGVLNFIFNSIALRQREKRPPSNPRRIHALGGRGFSFRPLLFMIRKAHRDS
jgi:hypothetical protein